MEGVPDGHVAVIGHGSQEAAVSYTQGKEEVHLGQAASQGDGAVMAIRLANSLGTVTEVKQRSAKDRWASRKYMVA